ncbi:MAG TPA: YigZ family protein, partial [Anaerolineaceae bacterium]|nr:YigZ family protein [Anaerolineaceae bacterium]
PMPTSPYLIPAAPAESEILVVNSRFIASLSPAFSVEEARAFHKSIRQRFPDATHHVPAFVIGHGNSVITHCSDDGEPSGTAGRPALAVLQGSGLGDAAVVVTRYFGGTLLGTGGLVKAYGDAVREVLKLVRRAIKVPTTTIGVQLPYPLFEQVQRLAAAHGGEQLESQFLADVTLILRFRDEELDAFLQQLTNLSAGQIQPVVLERNPETIFPLP